MDLGAVGAAAAGDVDDGADNDGSGTYQIYLPKLVKARYMHRISSRLRRLLGREPVVRRCFSWAGNPRPFFALTLPLLAGGQGAPGPRGGDAHAGCGAWRAFDNLG